MLKKFMHYFWLTILTLLVAATGALAYSNLENGALHTDETELGR